MHETMYLCGSAKHQCMQDIVESDEAINNAETDSKFQRPLELPRSSGKLAELLQKIRRKEINKRSEFRIPFHINDELTIGIVGYVFNRKCVVVDFTDLTLVTLAMHLYVNKLVAIFKRCS